MVLGAIGLSERAAQADETFWAVRRLLERVARERPLVVVVEDVHWAEPTLLDLLEYLVAFSSGHPLLLVCLARPEFVEMRPVWVAPLPNRSLLMLDALSPAAARRAGRERQCRRASVRAGRRGSWTWPRATRSSSSSSWSWKRRAGTPPCLSNIQAVLAARIDRLEHGERAVLELAAVQGRSFYVGAVADLMAEPDRAGIATHLVSLVQQQLIRADRSDVPSEDAFRFAHALIREAAYQALPKQRRAELHERVARWLEACPGAQEETVGYHLGEAYRHLAELGPVGARERALAATAAERLAVAGRAALLRGDPPAGARLLEQAESLMEPADPARLALLPRFGAALLAAGRLADADRVLGRGDRARRRRPAA